MTTALLVATIGLFLAACGEMRRGRGAPCAEGLEVVRLGGEIFCAEVAADDASRTRGLMDRASLPENGGMLFIFPDAQMRNFWMAHCVIDIDLIFLDPRGRITAMHRMKALPPQREGESTIAYEARMRLVEYPSRFPAQFAIELPAGSLDHLGLEVDDLVHLDLPRLKAMAR